VKNTRAAEDSNEDTHIREAEGRAMHILDEEEERVVRHEEVRVVRMDEDEAGGMRMDVVVVVGNMGNNMDNGRDNDHDRRGTGLALDLDHRVRLSLVSWVQCCCCLEWLSC